MHMTDERQRIGRRYAQSSEESVTNEKQTEEKLRHLTERASGSAETQSPLVPVEALITIEAEGWVWQTVSKDTLEALSHRLVLQSDDGRRRELFMTQGFDAAVDAASRIVEFQNGVVLIETLDP
jgi:hypothetical protein